MTISRGAHALATAALLLAAVSACTDDSGEATPTEGPSGASSPPPSSQPSPSTDSEIAADAVSQVVHDYFAAVDGLRQDPAGALSELKAVATGSELSAQQILIRTERSKGLRQTGDTRLAKLTMQSMNLDNSDDEGGKVLTAQVDVCWDVTDVDLIDENGKSVVVPSRPNRGWIRFTVTNHHWTTDPNGGWRVMSGQDLERTPCMAP
jgi:hypothetical protein